MQEVGVRIAAEYEQAARAAGHHSCAQCKGNRGAAPPPERDCAPDSAGGVWGGRGVFGLFCCQLFKKRWKALLRACVGAAAAPSDGAHALRLASPRRPRPRRPPPETLAARSLGVRMPCPVSMTLGKPSRLSTRLGTRRRSRDVDAQGGEGGRRAGASLAGRGGSRKVASRAGGRSGVTRK